MLCKCNSGLPNTGYSCSVNGQVIVLSLFFNRIKSDGSFNGIDFDALAVDGVIPAAAIDALINNPIEADRMYPVGNFENVEDTRAENVTQTFNSGNVVKIKDGLRTFGGLLIKKSADYVNKLNAFGCNDIAVLHVDTDGNIIGESLDGNFLRGISIGVGTFSAVYNKTTDTEINAVNLTYAYSQTVNDGNLRLIEAAQTKTDMTSIRGLLDASLAITVPATVTQVTVQAVVNYGVSISDKLKLKSLVLADFVADNVTQSSVITIDSVDVADAANGIYVLNYAAGLAVTETIKVSATKTGYVIAPVTGVAV